MRAFVAMLLTLAALVMGGAHAGPARSWSRPVATSDLPSLAVDAEMEDMIVPLPIESKHFQDYVQELIEEYAPGWHPTRPPGPRCHLEP
jgi:hypothetical protein